VPPSTNTEVRSEIVHIALTMAQMNYSNRKRDIQSNDDLAVSVNTQAALLVRAAERTHVSL
jgi:hypothetical protein